MEKIQFIIVAIIAVWAAYKEHYIFAAFFVSILLFMIWSYVKRRRMQKKLLAKYNYETSPVMEIRVLIYKLKINDFAGVKRIIGDSLDNIKTKEEWKVALELFDAFSPTGYASSPGSQAGLGGAIANEKLKKLMPSQTSQRIVVAEMNDGTVRVAWGLYLITDEKLHKFYDSAKKNGVKVEDEERTTGSIFGK